MVRMMRQYDRIASRYTRIGFVFVCAISAGANAQLGQCPPVILPKPAWNAGISINHMVSADINSDGNPDLIAVAEDHPTYSAEGAVRIWTGLGNGSFVLHTTLRFPNGVNGSTAQVAVNDVNRDGNPDIVVLTRFPTDAKSLSVFLGLSLGGWSQPARFQVGAQHLGFAVADLNGAQGRDLAVLLNATEVALLLNTGLPDPSEMFALPKVLPVPAGTNAIALAPLTNGLPELFTLHRPTSPPNRLRRFPNNGFGDFSPANSVPTEVGLNPGTLLMADVDNDGDIDAVVGASCNGCSPTLVVLKGNGAGGFVAQPAIASAAYVTWLGSADFNGNGIDDLIVGNSVNNQIFIHSGLGNGAFVDTGGISSPVSPKSIALGDFNSDGRVDIAVTDGPQIQILSNISGSPGFTTQPQSKSASCKQTQEFKVEVSGQSTPQFRWRRNGTDLVNDATYQGVTTDTLTVLHPSAANAGTYDCVATNVCGTTRSRPAVLSVCSSDLNCDQRVDDADFLKFVSAYSVLLCDDPAMPVGCPADLDGDGLINDSDFLIFVVAYNALLCS